MQDFFVYMLKVVACSAVFSLYYRLCLYNRTFHQWNRFYLLFSVLASATIPLLHIGVLPPSTVERPIYAVRSLNMLSSSSGFHDYGGAAMQQGVSVFSVLQMIYITGAVILLVVLVRSLVLLLNLIHRSPVTQHLGFTLRYTSDRSAPFSFFGLMFWHKRIDIHSAAGDRIFRHELEHVRQWHSVDKLLMNVLLVIFWCNPFFWLIRRELTLVHEFMADQESIAGADTEVLSSMMLLSVFSIDLDALTSRFSFSPIKRRLSMLSTLKQPGKAPVNSRLLVAPVILGLLAAFSFTQRRTELISSNNGTASSVKSYKVIIDAGHGGSDAGAVSADGSMEKDIVLAIAKQIKLLNDNPSIHIELSRSIDELQPLQNKVDEAVAKKADAFVSIHVNLAPENESGFEVFVSNKGSLWMSRSVSLGNSLSKSLGDVYAVKPGLQRRIGQGVWVLDASTISYPAVLVECGNINNPADLSYISNSSHQADIAKSILKGLTGYVRSTVRP